MEITVILALMVATFFTVTGYFARSTRQMIFFLSIQAMALGSFQLIVSIIELVLGLHLQALFDFSIAFAEWFFSAVVTPLIIYWGMIKTKSTDEPIISEQRITTFAVAALVPCMVLWASSFLLLPEIFDTFPFISFMFSLSILLMVKERDPLRILVGLNMAENALFPFLAESPVILIPFMLTLVTFVNVVGVFVIVQAYRDYGLMLVDKWRAMG
jgi:hypothetical protein